ncbi:carboxypeptidase-like regulatory domain-containing protein [Portibacter lacus]|uniref:VWFA domain-containing protein n=1 Tax=Portibacter lacus TaxID=1099794 RepID=A0AA37WFI3_9BACT|nr:carboxypeptidase-like regulatory domain-containing protein [Portibacter lacus]GLR18642.1 hypothetical protein GCM10007940_32580 [Portibacter lacus]
MKSILLLSTIFCLAFSTKFIRSFENIKVAGVVFDTKGEPIHGATVFVLGTKKGTMTDSLGQFEMMVPVETKKLTIKHYGYKAQDVNITLRKALRVFLEEGRTTTEKHRDLAIMESSSARREKKLMSHSALKPSPVLPASTFSEGIADDYAESEASTSPEGRGKVKEMTKSEVDTRAGQLTAGEWNDLNNWEAWMKLVEEADYKEMGEYWQVNAKERVSVFVTNQYELPIADCLVTMKSSGKIVWTSKTDNAGKAELWTETIGENMELIVESRENKFTSTKVRTAKEGVNRINFKEECDAPRKAEIMFVVDATGSMGDEIEFLKSELKDVIGQVESSRSNIDFSWGSVFYRDATDDYLTVQSPLSSKEKKVLDFINMQSAGGGGDYPEAVNEGLEEALMQDWSHDAIARIVFLVLDAPPHHNQDVLKDLQSQIAFASAMGIKIIPITASGINRQTEYLMKFMSVMTNGTYVFLTDHSGIGNAHLDPIVKDFEVEKLNDLLVRVIINYTDPGTCQSQEDNNVVFENIEVFPNPTLDLLQVKVPSGVNKITLTTSSGMLIHSEKITAQCDVSLDLTNYVDGMYVVNFFADEQVYSVKVIKSNKA